jgi:hypothetical protein
MEAAVATKKTYDPAKDPLMMALAELQRIEARYGMLDELVITLKTHTLEKTYAEAEFAELAWRRDAVQLYATTLQAQSVEGCLGQVRLLKLFFGLIHDNREEPESPVDREHCAACDRLIYSIDAFMSKATDFPLYIARHTNPFLPFEERLKDIEESRAERATRKASA